MCLYILKYIYLSRVFSDSFFKSLLLFFFEAFVSLKPLAKLSIYGWLKQTLTQPVICVA